MEEDTEEEEEGGDYDAERGAEERRGREGSDGIRMRNGALKLSRN